MNRLSLLLCLASAAAAPAAAVAGDLPAFARGEDLTASAQRVDGDAVHATLGRPDLPVWSYAIAADGQDVLDPAQREPLPQTGPGLYAEVQKGEGEDKYFVRHDLSATPEGLRIIWNRKDNLPQTRYGGGAVAAVFEAPEAGRYAVTGPLAWTLFGAGPTDTAAVKVAVERRGRSEVLFEQQLQADQPFDAPQRIVDLGELPELQGLDLRQGDKLVLALQGDRFNYRGVTLDDSAVRVTPAGAVARADAASPDDLAVQGFFSYVDLERPALSAVAEAVRGGDLHGAMALYTDHLVAETAAAEVAHEAYVWLWAPSTADELLEGTAAYAHYGEPETITRAPIGEPGEVAWQRIPGDGYAIFTRDLNTMQWATRLAEAALETGDAMYANRWSGYWGDMGARWLTEQRELERDEAKVALAEKRSFLWPTRALLYPAWRLESLLTGLKLVADSAGDRPGRELIDPVDLAHALSHAASFELGFAVDKLSAPGGVPNQRRHLAVSTLMAGCLLQDLKDAPAWRESGLREIRAYLTREAMPDGTEQEQSFNYNQTLPKMLNQSTALLGNLPRSPERDEAIADLSGYAELRWAMLHGLLDPDGTLPSIGKHNPYRVPTYWPEEGELAGLPISRAIFSAVNGESERPAFSSVYFPYGGYAALRTGWEADDAWLMIKTSRPGAGHRREGGNGLRVHAFGGPLLINSGSEQYSANGQYREYFNHTISQNSIAVDGLSQYIGDAGVENEGDGFYRDPIDARYVHTDRLDFLEGTYAGRYAGWNFNEHGSADDGNAILAAAKDPSAGISGVTHRREVIFLREIPAWIVTDRIATDAPHTFTQSWCFPPERPADGVVLEPESLTIRGPATADLPGVEIHQVSALPVSYAAHHAVHEPHRILGWSSKDRGDRTFDFYPAVDVHAQWEADAEHAIVSLVLPLPAGGGPSPVTGWAPAADGLGFTLELAGRTTVAYGTTASGAAEGDRPGVSLQMDSPAGPLVLTLGDATGAPDALTLPGGQVPVTVPAGFAWVDTPSGPVPSYAAKSAVGRGAP